MFPEYLKIISDEALPGVKLLFRVLLNFSRQSEPEFIRIDINRVVNNTIAVVQHQSQIKMQNIQLNLSEEPCEVIGDPQQLKQVFMNLIINALHATEGYGDISISTSRNQTVVQIIVKDAGIGIKRNTSARYSIRFLLRNPQEKAQDLACLYVMVL